MLSRSGFELDVERKLGTLWPGAAEQARARELLGAYGSVEAEATRVRLALLKLCDGKLEELAAMLLAAQTDYRDVLAWAEYPEEAGATWATRSELTLAERRQLKAIRARDREQYQAWLKS
jgi:hypothetical protein